MKNDTVLKMAKRRAKSNIEYLEGASKRYPNNVVVQVSLEEEKRHLKELEEMEDFKC